jgi:hypothetical protein
MPRAVFEPAISATRRPQTYALDRAATRIGEFLKTEYELMCTFLTYAARLFCYSLPHIIHKVQNCLLGCTAV